MHLGSLTRARGMHLGGMTRPRGLHRGALTFPWRVAPGAGGVARAPVALKETAPTSPQSVLLLYRRVPPRRCNAEGAVTQRIVTTAP